MEELQPTLTIKSFGPRTKLKMEPLDNPATYHMTGGYEKVDGLPFIKNRARYVKNTLLTAKLPAPVSVTPESVMKEQPAKNINDPSFVSLSDLSFDEQKDVLGKDPEELFTIRNNKFIEKLRKTQETEIYKNPPPKLNPKQLKQILERI